MSPVGVEDYYIVLEAGQHRSLSGLPAFPGLQRRDSGVKARERLSTLVREELEEFPCSQPVLEPRQFALADTPSTSTEGKEEAKRGHALASQRVPCGYAL